jgi:hypothetical protein
VSIAQIGVGTFRGGNQLIDSSAFAEESLNGTQGQVAVILPARLADQAEAVLVDRLKGLTRRCSGRSDKARR